MTNQEKIDELVPIISANRKLLPMCLMSNYQCRSKVRQMAEWKDQQFKEFLNKIGRGEKWAAFERFMNEKNR